MLIHATLAALLTVAQGPPAGAIEGIVRGYLSGSGDPLPFATVQVTVGGSRLSAVTDSLGRYRIERLAVGLVVLTVSHPGHLPASINVQVPSGRAVSLDIDLERLPIELEPIDVLGEPNIIAPPVDQADRAVAIPELEIVALEASPGLGESGLGEAAAALPGNDPADPSDVLFMRGSTTDLKLVLLDGAPVYTPFHLGGLLQSFDPSSLRAAALHVGGAPARYDGGLSYILDLRTRSPRRDRLTMTGSADLLSGQIAVEGPLGDRVGFAVSGRALHDMGSAALGSGHTPYGYRDALGRLEATLAEGHRLTATGFWNTESVLLTSGDGPPVTPSRPGPDDASWGNRVVVLAYRGGIGTVTLDATVSASDYRAELPLRPISDTSAAFDGFLASAETRRLRLTLDASAPLGDRRIRFGASVDRVTNRYSAQLLRDPSSVPEETEAEGVVTGVYVDGVRRLADHVDVRAGLRADAFSTEARVRMAPRVAFLFNLSPDVLLTVAAGRYHQYTRATDRNVELAVSGPTPSAPAGPLLSVATADHVVLSLDQELKGGIRLGIMGFWKNFTGLGGPGSVPLTNSGLDLRVAHWGERTTAWLGYNLSWFWSGTDAQGTSSEFTGRQLLSAGLNGPLGAHTGGSLRLAYSAGLPFTTIPLGQQQGAADALSVPEAEGPLANGNPAFSGSTLSDGFLRVDLELFARFNTTLGGRNVEIRPYLKLLNALDRRDALFFYFAPWRDDDLRPIAERSVLPVLGVQWRF